MLQPPLPIEVLNSLMAGIDAGIQAHLAWNQKLLRCALLLESPGDEMLRPQSHLLCRFGVWFLRERSQLDKVDARLVAGIDRAHARMHQAVRGLCLAKLGGHAASDADMGAYEREQSAMVARLSELKHLMETATSRIDPLTGLPLRHGLEAAFEQCRRDARRAGSQLFVAMVDLDHFKSVNDRFGHQAGDLALRHVVDRLRTVLRESDPFFRFGGEEFVALLRCESEAAAQTVVARMLDDLRAHAVEVQAGVPLTITATIGLAEVQAQETMDAAISRADHALLEGKLHGRDRVVVAQIAPKRD